MLETLYASSIAEKSSVGQQHSAWNDLSNGENLTVVQTLAQAQSVTDAPFNGAALQRDLDAGYHVAIGSGSAPAWWRIDPVTGSATGVDAFGRGGIIEKAFLEAYHSLKLAHALVSFNDIFNDIAQCVDAGGSIWDVAAIAGYTAAKHVVFNGFKRVPGLKDIPTAQDVESWKGIGLPYHLFSSLYMVHSTSTTLLDVTPSDFVWNHICGD